MNLNTVIKKYKILIDLQKSNARTLDKIKLNSEEETTLDRQLHTLNKDISQLENKVQEKNRQLDIQNQKLQALASELDQSNITPRMLNLKEKHYQNLATETQTIEKHTVQLEQILSSLQTLFKNAGFKTIFNQIQKLEPLVKKLTTQRKRLTTNNKKLEQKKNDLALDLEKVNQRIHALKEKHKDEIDHLTACKNETPKLKKQKKILEKQTGQLDHNIKDLNSRLENDGTPAIIEQYEQELRQCNHELEDEKAIRQKKQTEKQEIADQVHRETQRLENIEHEIRELQSITTETIEFLKRKDISVLDTLEPGNAPSREKTVETIRYLREYYRGTIVPQDARTRRN